jgi:hypothetical protein
MLSRLKVVKDIMLAFIGGVVLAGILVWYIIEEARKDKSDADRFERDLSILP